MILLKLSIKIKTNKETYVIVFVICLAFALLTFLIVSLETHAQQRDTLVEWTPVSKPEETTRHIPSYFTGANKSAALTRSNETVIPGGAGGTKKDGPQFSFYSRGWNSDDQWWQLSDISTGGFESIELSFTVKGSDTGPKNFALEYSADGIEWLPLTNSSHSPITYSIIADNKFHQQGPYHLSAGIDDLERLYIRFVNSDEESIAGGPTKNVGTNYISDIMITGMPKK